jgi:hypothetical protein
MYVFHAYDPFLANGCSLSALKFIQRQRALALWREIVRSTANIPEEGARKDMRQFARAEFEQQRGVTDIVSIFLCRLQKD